MLLEHSDPQAAIEHVRAGPLVFVLEVLRDAVSGLRFGGCGVYLVRNLMLAYKLRSLE
jgi:hypothetical protein